MPDGEGILTEVEVFELTHAVAVDNELNLLIRALYRSGVLDRETVEKIDAAYRQPLARQSTNALAVSVGRMHDQFFTEMLAEEQPVLTSPQRRA